MRAGILRHRVALHSLTGAQDDYGEPIETWAAYATVWARVSPLQGKELINAQQVLAECTHDVEIRYNSNVTAADRVIHKSRTLEIMSIIDPDERNKNLILICKELV